MAPLIKTVLSTSSSEDGLVLSRITNPDSANEVKEDHGKIFIDFNMFFAPLRKHDLNSEFENSKC